MTGERRGSIPLGNFTRLIMRGTEEHFTTAELWASVHAAAQAEGYTRVRGGIEAMNTFRARASAILQGARNYARAAPGATITPSMFAPDMNVTNIAGLSLTPVYRVRFEHLIRTLENVTLTTYRVWSQPLNLPGTKELLQAEIEAQARAFAEQYGEEHLGTGAVQITVV